MKNFHIEIKDLFKAAIFIKGKNMGELCYSLKYNNIEFNAIQLIYQPERNELKALFNQGEINDIFQLAEDELIIARNYQIFLKGMWKLVFSFIPHLADQPEWIVPAVMYQKNTHGNGKYPKGGLEAGWAFREDRIPVPSCSILYDSTQSCSIWCDPADDDKYLSSVKTYMKETHPCFEISIPYTEEPYTYTDKGIVSRGLKKAKEKFIRIGSGSLPFKYEKKYHIAFYKNLHPLCIHRKIAQSCEDHFSDKSAEISLSNVSKTASLKLRHLLYMSIDDGRVAGIKLGKGNGILQLFYNYTTGSFLGKSLEGAYIFARAGAELKDDSLLELSEKIAAFYMNGSLQGGLHHDTYNLKTGKWAGYLAMAPDKRITEGVNTRCNGEVMYNYLRLYKTLKARGRIHNEYIELVEKNIDFYLNHQLRGDYEGSYGRWWTKDGNVINALGTNGSYIMSLIIERTKMNGVKAGYIESLDKAAKYYMTLVDSGSFYADTLDADCIDKEAGVALLRAFMDMYEINKDEHLLQYAEKCACFILSWLWMYNVNFNKGSLLGKEEFKTKGMTSVSVAHHHLDFYGMYIAYDFLRLWQASSDSFWYKQASDMAAACLQLISSPGNLLNRSRKYIGWQPEQINQTNWTYHHPVMGTKGKYHTCVAWNTVLTLGAMLDIRDRFPEFMNFRFDSQLCET